MGKSKIEWTDETWNPIIGCRRISPGCEHCYAERQAIRIKGYRDRGVIKSTPSGPRWTGRLELMESRLADPLHWREPRLIFVCSMSDLFHEKVPDQALDQIFAVMALAPRHTFQVLTKRPKRMRDYLKAARFGQINEAAQEISGRDDIAVLPTQRHGMVPGEWPLPNVWLGVSVENQTALAERIPILLDTPAAVRWVSAEPLLGPVTFCFPHLDYLAGWNSIPEHAPGCQGECTECPVEGQEQIEKIDWIVAGGESGPGARPMHPAWLRSIRDQCAAAGTKFLFKQWGAWKHAPEGKIEGGTSTMMDIKGNWFTWDTAGKRIGNSDSIAPGSTRMHRVGKKAAGRELDGRIHDAYPETK